MKAFSQTLGIALTGLLLTAGPALAQGDRGGAAGAGAGGDRGGSTTSSGGGASAGTGGGGNIVSSGGGGGGSVSSGGGGGGDFSSPSASSFSSPSISMGDRGFRSSAPEHRVNHSQTSARQTATGGDDQRAVPRSASGGSSASSGSPASGGRASEGGGARERAVSRGTGTASREGGGSRRASESTNNVNGVNEVPNWSRPRGDRPATDVAVTRTGPRPPRDSGDRNNPDRYYGPGYGNDYPYYPSYPGDPYYGYGYGYGCGYYCGYYGYPFALYGFGYGIPSGYFDPFYGDPNEYGEGYGGYSNRVYGGQDQGSLKLKVKPRKAKVYVDGYYVGVVDEFDGAFQKLTLNGGRHKVELRAEGYETTEFDVLITPEHTVTFAGDMKKAQ